MKLTFASLKTTGKVETVWAVISMEQPSDRSLLRYNSIKFTDYIIASKALYGGTYNQVCMLTMR